MMLGAHLDRHSLHVFALNMLCSYGWRLTVEGGASRRFSALWVRSKPLKHRALYKYPHLIDSVLQGPVLHRQNLPLSSRDVLRLFYCVSFSIGLFLTPS